MEVIKKLKDRIKQIRKNAKLTQVEFGEKIGVKGNTITNYENGLRNPTDAVILSICREFNINEDWLRTGEGEMFIETSEDEQIAEFVGRALSSKPETFKKRLILALSTLDDDEWDLLEKILDKMAEKKE